MDENSHIIESVLFFSSSTSATSPHHQPAPYYSQTGAPSATTSPRTSPQIRSSNRWCQHARLSSCASSASAWRGSRKVAQIIINSSWLYPGHQLSNYDNLVRVVCRWWSSSAHESHTKIGSRHRMLSYFWPATPSVGRNIRYSSWSTSSITTKKTIMMPRSWIAFRLLHSTVFWIRPNPGKWCSLHSTTFIKKTCSTVIKNYLLVNTTARIAGRHTQR